MRTDLLGEVELLLRDVEGDDPRGGEVPQHLDGDVPQAARADHDGGRAAEKLAQRRLDRVVGREAGVGEGHRGDGIEVADGNEVPRVVDDDVLGHGAVVSQAGRRDLQVGCPRAVVLEALRTEVAHSATPRPVDGDRRTLTDRRNPLSQFGDHTDTLVAEGHRERVRECAFRRVQHEVVGVARASRGDLDENLTWTRRGLRNVAELGFGSGFDHLDGLHR